MLVKTIFLFMFQLPENDVILRLICERIWEIWKKGKGEREPFVG